MGAETENEKNADHHAAARLAKGMATLYSKLCN